jgi:hypothetical protein
MVVSLMKRDSPLADHSEMQGMQGWVTNEPLFTAAADDPSQSGPTAQKIIV